MRESDFPAFAALLDDVAALLPPAQPLGPTARAMFFRALAEHDLASVRAALDAHVKDAQRGRWFPRPADLIAQLEARAGDDGRPGAEEAWAIAIPAASEAETIVWTVETAVAWGIAWPVLAAGDEVGARMAFREAYNRLVLAARAERIPVQWSACLGTDSTRRAGALRRAAELGRLPMGDAMAMASLPAPRSAVLLLAGAAPDAAGLPNAAAIEALAAVRKALASSAEVASADAVERERTAALKAQAAARVEAFERDRQEDAP